MKYNQFLQECLTNAADAESKKVTGEPAVKSVSQNICAGPLTGNREKIGVLDTEPKKIGQMPEGLNAKQHELLKEVLKRFTVHKINKYLEEQVRHINYKRHLSETMRLLFDEHGKPPANAPLEDIIATRKKMEAEIRMLEAICSAMHISLSKVREIEDSALESIQIAVGLVIGMGLN